MTNNELIKIKELLVEAQLIARSCKDDTKAIRKILHEYVGELQEQRERLHRDEPL